MIYSCKFDAKAFRSLIDSADGVTSITYDKAVSYINSAECTFFGVYNANELAASLLCFVFELEFQGKNIYASYLDGFAQRGKYANKNALLSLADYCILQLKAKGVKTVMCPENAPKMFEDMLGFKQKVRKMKVLALNDGKKCSMGFKRASSASDFAQALDIYTQSIHKNGVCGAVRSIKSFESKVLLSEGSLYISSDSYFIYNAKCVCEFMTLGDENKLLKNIARFFEQDLYAYTAMGIRNNAPEQLTFDIPGLDEWESAEVLDEGREKVAFALEKRLAGDFDAQHLYF